MMPKLHGPEVPIKSRGTKDRVWPVYPAVPYCLCPAFEHNGDCWHVQKARNKLLVENSEYLLTRYERKLKQRFTSFEMFYDWCWEGRGKPEIVYLSNLFIALLYCAETGEGTTDLIHYAVQEKFQGDPRRVGAVTKRLEEAEIIEKVLKPNGAAKEIPSERRINHGSMKKVYRLTEKGKRMIGAVT